MTAAAVALIAGAGVDRLVVHRLPRVAVLATGDEVRAPGEALGEAGIPDANGPGLRALVTAAGGEAIDLGIAKDDLDDVLTPPSRRRSPTAPTRSSSRAACRSARTTSSRPRSRPSARSTSGGSPSSPASRSRSGPPTGRAAARRSSCSAFPAIRCRRGHLRALRPSGHPRARGPARTASTGRSRRPRRAGLQEPGPQGVHPRRGRSRRDRRPDPRRPGPRPRPSRGRAGESRHLGPRRRRRSGGHSRSRRFTPRRRRGRALVARPRMMVA